MNKRQATVKRETKETRIRCVIDLDGNGAGKIKTGVGFLDHMLDSLARHSGFDIELSCDGDLAVDDHHSVEDCAIVLGDAFAKALGDKKGIARFGSAYAPLDEALARTVVDLSGRPYWVIDMGLARERVGDLSCENIPHFFISFAASAKITLHLDVLRGENDHHRAEAAFKSFALALRFATRSGEGNDVPSTKGVL